MFQYTLGGQTGTQITLLYVASGKAGVLHS